MDYPQKTVFTIYYHNFRNLLTLTACNNSANCMRSKSISINSFLPGIIILFSSCNIFAQDGGNDSSFYQKALVNTMAIYHQSFGYQSALYNGSKYEAYLFKFEGGHPYFDSPQAVAGSVIYDGVMYDTVLMHYDEVKDVLLISNLADWLQLSGDKVERFTLFNSDFIRVQKDSLSTALVSSGFYNVLYNGEVSLLKKQIKTIREVIIGLELQHFADKKDYYYIRKDDRYYAIKSRKDLFEVVGDRKKEMQQFVRGNKLSFRKDRQTMLTKAVAYYNGLKNK